MSISLDTTSGSFYVKVICYGALTIPHKKIYLNLGSTFGKFLYIYTHNILKILSKSIEHLNVFYMKGTFAKLFFL